MTTPENPDEPTGTPGPDPERPVRDTPPSTSEDALDDPSAPSQRPREPDDEDPQPCRCTRETPDREDTATSSVPVAAAGPAASERPRQETVRVESPRRDGAVNEVAHMDRVRWLLARHLIWLLWTVIILVFLLVGTSGWTEVPFDDVRSVFELMFTALVALVGSAVGFYYGTTGASGGSDDQ